MNEEMSIERLLDQELEPVIRMEVGRYMHKIDAVLDPLKHNGSGRIVIEFEAKQFEQIEIIKRQDGSTLVSIPFEYAGANVLRTALIGSCRKIAERRLRGEARRRIAASIAGGMFKELSKKEDLS